MSVAERSRLYRRRFNRGLMVVPVVVGIDDREELIAMGYLDKSRDGDKPLIANAIKRHIADSRRRQLNPNRIGSPRIG